MSGGRDPLLAELAMMFDISIHHIMAAQVVLERGIPELIKDVEGGKLDVFAAAYIAKMPKKKQREVVW